MPNPTDPGKSGRVTENPNTAVSMMPAIPYVANVPVTDASASTATVAAACWPNPIALRRRCVVAHRLAPAHPKRNAVMPPQIIHVEPGATPTAGGPTRATDTHTTTAIRLELRVEKAQRPPVTAVPTGGERCSTQNRPLLTGRRVHARTLDHHQASLRT